ncbi:MAG: permease [Clostridia bacterium]|nr:permease [Clostridia bacterium]
MGNYRNFKLATYFVAHATARVTREELETQLNAILKYLRLDKVYLEAYRGEQASHEQVEMCKEVFLAHGIEVSGGITTVMRTPEGAKPKARLFDTMCYNDPVMRARLREASAFTAQHFDEFIIDDFFFTNCMCENCIREKNAYNQAHGITDGSWQAYRLDLMRRVSAEDMIGPAKAVNPNVRIIIKYPNWAKSYQETGYNPKDQREMFDAIYTGTEARDSEITDQHLPRYLSFSLMTYMEAMWPGHNGGGWFDTFDVSVTEHYLEQAYLTAFSKPRELMLFCFQSLQDNMLAAALGFQLDKLDKLLDYAGSPVGIACYLPDNGQGEDNVQDFLGMNGLPIVCTPYFPENAPAILLTRTSACDPDIVEKLERYLRETDGNALVTTGFIEATADRGIAALTSIRMRGRSLTADSYRVEGTGRSGCTYPEAAHPVTFPVPEFRNNATWAVVKACHGEENTAILLRDDYCDGHLWTLAVPDTYSDLYRLPAPVISRIREAFPVEGIWLEGPTRISLFIYDNDTFIVYPYVMTGARRAFGRLHVKGAKSLAIPGFPKPIEPLYTKGEEAIFEVPLTPGRFILYQIQR